MKTNIFVQIFGKCDIYIRVKAILNVCTENCAIVTLDLNGNYEYSQSQPIRNCEEMFSCL